MPPTSEREIELEKFTTWCPLRHAPVVRVQVLIAPAGVAVDTAGAVYVTDAGSSRVLKPPPA
jgi:hypothetical protein